MGDGYPAFAAALKPEMGKIGNQTFKAVAATGFSYGEDKCMLPPEAKADPQKARGHTVAAVPRDGDWNICVKWASDNGVPINTDNAVWDPNALNFIDTSSFTDADDKLITQACETRVVSHNGLKTAQPRQVCPDGVATWTPGDVDVVQKYKAGIVAVASTREYNQQMDGCVPIVNSSSAC
jgi:hypothetical protein